MWMVWWLIWLTCLTLLNSTSSQKDLRLSSFLSRNKIKEIKGSVERSLLPSAIFLIFTRNRPWKSEDHLCTLFFIEMSKEKLEKSERTQPVLWLPWALVFNSLILNWLGLGFGAAKDYNFQVIWAMHFPSEHNMVYIRFLHLCSGLLTGSDRVPVGTQAQVVSASNFLVSW